MTFPDRFAWGAATASYQIEGSAARAGGGLSVWDMFCRRPGKVYGMETGETACDHYNRWREDVALMRELGIRAYRFSISWPRVIPDGAGRVNSEGIDFYDRLVDALIESGITPYPTLFHWDYPYELYCRGGWLNRDSADWFADYTRLVVERLSDRVKHWMPLNEPQCFVGLGMVSGQHAPGDQVGLTEALRAGHHALLAHGKCVQAIRAHSKSPCEIGYAPVGVVRIPASTSAEDVQAAREAMFSVTEPTMWNNTWWMDPVFFGRYPEDGLQLFGSAAPAVRSGDMEIISQPLDFFGANIYNGQVVTAGAHGKPKDLPHTTGIGRTVYQWPVTPECLYWGPRFFFERYGKPVVITENGLANTDWVGLDGQIHDESRIDFLRRHLLQFEKAHAEGVDIRGYFHWSLLDNFEWNEGYRMRFGLVHVDFNTQKRTPKNSAAWFREVIKSNGASIRQA